MAQHTIYFPDTFLTQMHEAMPSTLSFDDFLATCQRPLRHSIHVNTLKISIADFLQLTTPYGWTLTPIPWCEEGFWIEHNNEDALPLGSTTKHLSSLFYIQEASSMLPIATLFADNNAPQQVMDVAAAPGSKTTQIATQMNNKGAILANEFSTSQVKVLHANISHCGISNVALTHFDGHMFGAAVPEMFNAILLDTPCSGKGMVHKDPNALKNWSPESNQEITATQQELINSTFHALHPGGTLVYSTCTLNQEENKAICLWLKETYPNTVEFLPLGNLFPGANKALTKEGFLHVFPQIYNCKGFFIAHLHKTQAIPTLPTPKYKVGNFPFSPVKDHEARQIHQAAASVGLNWDGNLQLWQHNKELWLFPVGIEALISKVQFSHLGIKLAKTHNKGYHWQHEAVIALATPNNVNTFELTPQEAEEWYHRHNVYPQATPVADDMLVTFQHQPIGLAKQIGSQLKNSYPRELVHNGKLFTSNT